MQKKKALLQSQLAQEHEQRLRATLARRVLGSSYERLYPRQAAAAAASAVTASSNPDLRTLPANTAGGEHASVSAEPCGATVELDTTASLLPGIDSQSQVPKLPPLADPSADGSASTGTAAVAMSTPAATASADSAGRGLSQVPSGCDNSHGQTRRRQTDAKSTGTTQRSTHVSRSVSAGAPTSRSFPLPSSPYLSDSGRAGSSTTATALGSSRGGARNLQQRTAPPTFTRGRSRRSAFPVARMRPVQEEDTGSDSSRGGAGCSSRSGSDEEDDEDGPDVGVRDRRPRHPHAQGRSTSGGRSGGGSGAGGGGGATHTAGTGGRHSSGLDRLATATRSTMRLSATAGLPPTISGYAQWRARAKLPDDQRTFCISGSGNHSQGIRAGLLERGWYENPDHNSPFFDFKWSANPLDINHDALWPGQIVNHYRHSVCLTTKHGLCHTLRDTAWYESADSAAFYPRAYDISDEASRREFLQDVRLTAAESLIKRALLDGAVCQSYVPYNPGAKRAGGGGGPPPQQPVATTAAPRQPTDTAVGGSERNHHNGGSGLAADSAEGPSGPSLGSADGGDRTAAAGEAEAEAGPGVDKADGGGAQSRLQQRTDSTPLVDLPSLRLACRLVALKLRQQRYLRVVHKSGGGGGGGGGGPSSAAEPPPADPPPADLELTTAQWQQLVRHRALSCSAPVLPPPQFDPAWISSRSFITSAMLPHTAAQRGGARGGGGRKSGDRHNSPRRRSHQRSPSRGSQGRGAQRRPRRVGGGGEVSAGTGTDGEGLTGASGSDDDGGASGAESAAVSDGEGVGFPAEGVSGGPVTVADAAELLREVYGRTRRRHSAPAAQRRRTDAQAAEDGEEGLSAVPSAAWGSGSAAEADGGGGEGGSGGDAGACASWLPEDLPDICYDDEALQALDADGWRDAAAAILSALESSAVQTHISGTNNIWIVKPAGKSRGRGIRLFNEPDSLLSYIRGEEAQGLESRWIAQKYVERPLIICRRKFDIRQWVLVTDWNPLQAWFYATCYLRFAADDYDPNNLDIFQHLTNNSVSKYYEGPKKEDEITAAGNMWSIPRFQQWLEEVYGRDDIWEVLLQPAMRHISICTLKSAQDHITPRKGSCQLYGFDFLIDDQLRVWLLEVNSSPTLEPSTAITSQLCADVQEDILKVVVDLPAKQAAAAAATRRRGTAAASFRGSGEGTAAAASGGTASADTGKWELIIDGGEELRQPQYTGLTLELKGTAIHLPPTSQAPRNNFVGRLYNATRQHQQPAQHHQPHQNHQQQSPYATQGPHPRSSSPDPTSSPNGTRGGPSSAGPSGVPTSTSGQPQSRTSSHPPAAASTSPGSLPSATAGPHAASTRGPLINAAKSATSLAPLRSHSSDAIAPLPPLSARGERGGEGCGDDSGGGAEEDGAVTSTGGATTLATPPARSRGGMSPPGSRGGGVSPSRARTPRLSASLPVASTSNWEGVLATPTSAVLGMAQMAQISEPFPSAVSGGSGGSGGGGSPVRPLSSRVVTPRGQELAQLMTMVYGNAAVGSGTGPLSPMAVRMSLLVRPGHQTLGAAGGRGR